jgi:hypothetical protein
MSESKSAALLNFPVRDRLFKLVPARTIGFEALRGNKHVQIKGNGVFPDAEVRGQLKIIKSNQSDRFALTCWLTR